MGKYTVKTILSLMVVSVIMLVSSTVHSAPPESPPAESRHRWTGIQADLGAPEGAAVGLVVSPYFDWLKLDASVTNNYFAWGGRVGATLDPIHFGIAPTGTVEYGMTARFNVSDIAKTNVPEASFDYINLLPGIEIGSPNRFRFFIRAGATYLWARTYNYPATDNLQLSNPKAHLWLAPTFKLGFTVMVF